MSNMWQQFEDMSLKPRPRNPMGPAGLTAQNSYDTLHEQFNRNMHLGGRKTKSYRTIRRRSRRRARSNRRNRK